MTHPIDPSTGRPDDHDPQTCAQAREEAAVALLTRRRPSDHVLAHLEACPPCRDEYHELARLPELLDGARQAGAADPEPAPGPDLLDRLLVEVARQRRRRRLITGLLVAAAVIAVTIPTARWVWPGADGSGGTGIAGGPPGSSAPTSPGTPTSPGAPGGPVWAAGTGSDPSTGTRARVQVSADESGSVVSIAVTGIAPGRTCRMLIRDAAGTTRDAGSWTVPSTGQASYVEEVALPPSQVQAVQLVDGGSGSTILDIPVRRV